MTDALPICPSSPSIEEIQRCWPDIASRLAQVEAENQALEQTNKALRKQLETLIQHRQQSHSELVILLTNLVSKLPINDVGVIISKLVEHNASVSRFLCGLGKGSTEAVMAQPNILKNLEQTKRDLAASIQPLIEELLKFGTPIEKELLTTLPVNPESFFSPSMIRATRCYVKGQVPRDRVLREFGSEALPFFNDMTTDPKLNPRPKPDEIVLCFRPDFEGAQGNGSALNSEKRAALLDLYQRVQKSKAATPEAKAQRNAFTRLSFILELLHYYANQNTEAPETAFAHRLPALVEQLVIPSAQETLDPKLLSQGEELLGFIISGEHRQSVINNIGKAGGIWKTLRYVLKLRGEKTPDFDHIIAEFVKHLVPAPPARPPQPAELAILKLLPQESQRAVLRTLMSSDRMRKSDSEALAKATATDIGLPQDQVKIQECVSPELERQIAWSRIRDMITRRSDPALVANTIRERLNAHYDAEEIRQSWLALTDADPILLIRIFSHLPYLPSGKTDAIARPVLETYVSRLTHEKYAGTLNRVVKSLRSMYQAKRDSPTLVNFLALVRWINPDAANQLSHEIGMHVAA